MSNGNCRSPENVAIKSQKLNWNCWPKSVKRWLTIFRPQSILWLSVIFWEIGWLVCYSVNSVSSMFYGKTVCFLVRVPCEQRFLSGLTVNLYEFVRVASVVSLGFSHETLYSSLALTRSYQKHAVNMLKGSITSVIYKCSYCF